MFRWLLDRVRPHYLLHILVDGVHANTFIAGSLSDFIARQRLRGLRVVVVQAWRISRREYSHLKASTPPALRPD